MTQVDMFLCHFDDFANSYNHPSLDESTSMHCPYLHMHPDPSTDVPAGTRLDVGLGLLDKLLKILSLCHLVS